MRLQLAAVSLLLGLLLDASAADSIVTNGGTLARSKYVQTMTAGAAASISLVKPATDLLAWEIWNTGTNTITITNGVTGYQPVLSAGLGVILRGLTTNAWLMSSFDDAALTSLVNNIETNTLDLAGTRAMTGNSVTLARDVKSRDATSVDGHGVAMGYLTVAGNFGVAMGNNNVATEGGVAMGEDSIAGNYGAAFGSYSIGGDYSFTAGTGGKAAFGSFVFADHSAFPHLFDRTAYTNWFSVRASGGTYFETPNLAVTGSVTAASYGGEGVTNIWVITGIDTNGSGAVTGITTNLLRVLVQP